MDDYIKERLMFWTRFRQSDGFDVEHLMDTKPIIMFAGFAQFNRRYSVVYSGYYITLVAKDPASGGSLVTFQTRVLEEGFDIKQLTCPIARLKCGSRDNSKEKRSVDDCYQLRLPDEWPSENVFNDKKRYYVMKKSEVRKYDWVRLYMELAFFNANMKLKHLNLSKLVIMKVAVETEENVETPSERLKARNAVFYIRYRYHPNKGLAHKVHHGHKPPRDRVAIVKRTIDKNTGELTLQFDGRLSKTLL
ncbi:PREDICTED: UPF0725 protein At4g17990-like [Camelina sativa]|uniref:UPF0725 protein At4g17990-like n=1 Tax=Camelina sativa TaxID=90675 RepID=A0ABM1QQS6_CAMSA|nr:PREDICTED: UPF0725 protein At4g17990-like [Camelina sativa]